MIFVIVFLVIAVVILSVNQWFMRRDIKALTARHTRLYNRGRKRG